MTTNEIINELKKLEAKDIYSIIEKVAKANYKKAEQQVDKMWAVIEAGEGDIEESEEEEINQVLAANSHWDELASFCKETKAEL